VNVSVQSRQRRVVVSVARLAGVARTALASLGRADRDLDVAVVGDREMRRLNARYLGRASPTDVLAFGLDGPGPSPLLGQVIISADTAARQARRLGIATALEMDLLLVHGLLHLVGYDDHDPGQARLMHEREREILSRRRGPPPERLWTGLLQPRKVTRASPRQRRGSRSAPVAGAARRP